MIGKKLVCCPSHNKENFTNTEETQNRLNFTYITMQYSPRLFENSSLNSPRLQEIRTNRHALHHRKTSSLQIMRNLSSQYLVPPLMPCLEKARSNSCSRTSKPMESWCGLEVEKRNTCHNEREFLEFPSVSPTSLKYKKSSYYEKLQSKEEIEPEVLHLPTQDKSQFSCPICYSECELDDIVEPLSCKHKFCKGCVRGYIVKHIEEFTVLKIRCPQDECPSIFTDTDIQSILDKEMFVTYNRKKQIKLRNRDTRIRYCPQPGCTNPFYPDSKTKFTTCTCGTLICNECITPWHEGKPCTSALTDEYELFLEINNLKKCFICKTALDKHVGCSHINCPVCDYEWCWNCGREWEPGHTSRCVNKWDPTPPRALQKGKQLNFMDEFFNGIFLLLEILVFGLVVMVGVVFIWPYVMAGKFMEIIKARIKSYFMARIVSVCLALLTWPIALLLYPMSAIIEEYGICCRRKRWAKKGAKEFGFHKSFCQITRPQLKISKENRSVSEVAISAKNVVVERRVQTKPSEIVIKAKNKNQTNVNQVKESEIMGKQAPVEIVIQ